MALNYLPFQRRETVVVPPRKAERIQTGGFAVSNLARLATGGTRRAIVQELLVSCADTTCTYPDNQLDNSIRMRIGVDGRNYMTEDLYDYRVYFDKGMPLWSVWDWSCGKRTPYRLYPGQKMHVFCEPSPLLTAQVTDIPIAVQFNCMKVKHKSPIGTKEGEPMLLHGIYMPTDAEGLGNDPLSIESTRLNCPKDSPVDIYSVTFPECYMTTDATQRVYILDGNERPFWESNLWTNMVDIVSSPISLGYGGCILDPDETLRVELEEYSQVAVTGTNMWVTYRGVLEVDDGR